MVAKLMDLPDEKNLNSNIEIHKWRKEKFVKKYVWYLNSNIEIHKCQKSYNSKKMARI